MQKHKFTQIHILNNNEGFQDLQSTYLDNIDVHAASERLLFLGSLAVP